MDNEYNINNYLYYGYIPVDRSSSPLLDMVANNSTKQGTPVEDGKSIWEKIFHGAGAGPHIVPLSGGLDSRAILAGLMSADLNHQIHCVTFGTPGTFDFELGKSVAKRAGIRQESLDLMKVEITQNMLEDTASETKDCWTYLFDAVYNRLICDRFGPDATYWSGFMGDPLAGSHLEPDPSDRWSDAQHLFASKNSYGKDQNFQSPHFDPTSSLPRNPFVDKSVISFEEQLDIAVRQELCIKPIVLPEGYDYRTPFLEPDWIQHLLTQPFRKRLNQLYYTEFLVNNYPNLFNVGVKNKFGLAANAPHWQSKSAELFYRGLGKLRRVMPLLGSDRRENYVDVQKRWRTGPQFRKLINDNLNNLELRRGVPKRLIDKVRLTRNPKALLLLASLETYLRVTD